MDEKIDIKLADYIDPKCKECYGRGIVRQMMPCQGKMYPANLMCTCVEQTVKKLAKTDTTINVKMLLPQILAAFREEQEKIQVN